MLTTRQAFSRSLAAAAVKPDSRASQHDPKQRDRHLAARPQEDRGNNLPASMIRNMRGIATQPI